MSMRFRGKDIREFTREVREQFGGATPALPFKSVQFNDSGAFGGDAAFLWDKTLNHAAIDGSGTATLDQSLALNPTFYGTLTSHETLNVRDTYTLTGNQLHAAILGALTVNQSSAGSPYTWSVLGYAVIPSTSSFNWTTGSPVYGVGGLTDFRGTNASANAVMAGIYGEFIHGGTGGIRSGAGGRFRVLSTSSGAFDEAYGVFVEPPDTVSTPADNWYSGYFSTDAAASNPFATARFGIWVEGRTHKFGPIGLTILEGPTQCGRGSNIFTFPTGEFPTLNIKTNPIDIDVIQEDTIQFRSDAVTGSIKTGTSVENVRWNQFLAPTINGIAGGGTEKVTNLDTLYINNAPSGSDITITRASALRVEAGTVRFYELNAVIHNDEVVTHAGSVVFGG